MIAENQSDGRQESYRVNHRNERSKAWGRLVSRASWDCRDAERKRWVPGIEAQPQSGCRGCGPHTDGLGTEVNRDRRTVALGAVIVVKVQTVVLRSCGSPMGGCAPHTAHARPRPRDPIHRRPLITIGSVTVPGGPAHMLSRRDPGQNTRHQRGAVSADRQVPQRRSHEVDAYRQRDQVQGLVVQSEDEITAQDRERRYVL